MTRIVHLPEIDRGMPASDRAQARVAAMDDATLAAWLSEYADDIQRDTGRAYVPAFMREAAKRLAKRKRSRLSALRTPPPAGRRDVLGCREL